MLYCVALLSTRFQMAGLLVGSMIIAMRITEGKVRRSSSSFNASPRSLLIIYLTVQEQGFHCFHHLPHSGTSAFPCACCILLTQTQLYAPLNQLGFIYRSFNQSLVDTERLMKLLDEPTEVSDQPGAPQLIVEAGEIEFRTSLTCHLPKRLGAYSLNLIQKMSAFLTTGG